MGTEGYSEHSPIPRVIWVVVNGFMYKCSPESLRPITEDEVAFQHMAQECSSGHLPAELEQTDPSRGGPAGRYFDLTGDPPQEEDFESGPGSDMEGGEPPVEAVNEDPPNGMFEEESTMIRTATGIESQGMYLLVEARPCGKQKRNA